MRVLLSLVLALWVVPAAAARPQSEPVPPSSAEASPSAETPASESSCAEEYRVGNGDRLEIVVFGNDELSRTVSVRSDGSIVLPLVGEMAVAGASVPEIRDRLTEAYALYLVDPQVDVAVREYNSRFVALVGEVAQPGRRALGACTRVIDLLLQAGGFRDAASAEVVVSRGKGEEDELRARVDRGVFSAEARQVLETVLRGGEIVTVLPPSYVTVQGEVVRPNRYPIDGRLTVTGAVSLAGGLTRSGASKAKIVRSGADGDREVIEADLKAIRDGKEEDVVLQAEDIVTVPRKLF